MGVTLKQRGRCRHRDVCGGPWARGAPMGSEEASRARPWEGGEKEGWRCCGRAPTSESLIARCVAARVPWLPCWTAPFTLGLSSFRCDLGQGLGLPFTSPLPSSPSGWGKVVDLEWSIWGGVRGDWAVPRLQWVSAQTGGLTSDLWSCPLVVHSDSNGKGNQCSCGILEAPDAGNSPPWSSWNPQCLHLLFSWVFPSSLLFTLIHKGMFSLQGFIPKLLRPSTLEPAC